MKAVTRRVYGSPDVLRIEEVEKPELTDDGVLVRVRAASLNRGDWYGLRGRPLLARPLMGGIRAPKEPRLGTDFAGVVEAVGKDVTDVAVGDEVFGGRTGSFAEYVCARHAVARKPANVTFEEAAAVPVAALTALQGARDHARLGPGDAVLVNGASGGIGVYAVQIAKALGAGRVTAVCSTRNVELVESLGADRVIDYTSEDFTRSGERYDVVLDVAGSKPWWALRRVLEPNARVVLIGGPDTPLLGPTAHIGATWLATRGSKRKPVFYVAKFTRADMQVLADLVATGKVRPVVERTYPLSEIADAFRAMGAGHVQSKLVITV